MPQLPENNFILVISCDPKMFRENLTIIIDLLDKQESGHNEMDNAIRMLKILQEKIV